MAKEIALNTRTAMDEIEPKEEGELLKKAQGSTIPKRQLE